MTFSYFELLLANLHVCAAEGSFDELLVNMAEAVECLLVSPTCSVDSGASASGRRKWYWLHKELSVHDCNNMDCNCLYHNESSDHEESLDVYCPNQQLGCDWVGSLTNVVEHMNYECECLLNYLLLNEEVEMPMIIMMRDFEQLRHNKESWYSPVFCTHERGYHFRMRVDANGWHGNNNAVAVVVSIVKGDYDDQLQWPFEGVITVQILNHVSNTSNSILKEFEFIGGGYECQRVTDEAQPEYGCWCDQFIVHDSLSYDVMRKCQYLKNDCLFFLVSYRTLFS